MGSFIGHCMDTPLAGGKIKDDDAILDARKGWFVDEPSRGSDRTDHLHFPNREIPRP
jgi:hypothetical protein